MDLLSEISQALIVGKMDDVKSLVGKALEENMTPSQILNEGLLVGMDVVGQRFKSGEMYIPHVLLSARAMNAGMDILKPLLVETGVQSRGKFLIGTVKGDLHYIGKNLVNMMLQGKGFEVIDLGTDVSPEKFVQSIESDIKILGMSALLSSTRGFMKETIEALKSAGLKDQVKVMVGGGAVTQSFADEIGADAYAADAPTTAEIAVKLLA